jgi:hypothetical protein
VMSVSWKLFRLVFGAVPGSVVTKPYPGSGSRSCLVFCRKQRYYSGTASPVDLSGVFPPIPTPFNEDESIAYDKLAANLQQWEKIPFRG